MNNITAISMLLIFYTAILSVFFAISKKRPGITSYQHLRASDLKMLSIAHLVSVIFMILPAFLISSAPFFVLRFPDPGDKKMIALLVCVAAIVCVPLKSPRQKAEAIENYLLPSIQVILYGLSRFTFLIAYEWFFRGLLLMSLLPVVGTINAVIVNIILYMLAHFHKDKKEIIGCLPFGLLLCSFTIWWQSIWPAVIIHLLLAARTEWPPVYQFISPQKKLLQ